MVTASQMFRTDDQLAMSVPPLRGTWMCKCRERALPASCLPHHSYILYIAGCARAATA
jgi:hypothetical protein